MAERNSIQMQARKTRRQQESKSELPAQAVLQAHSDLTIRQVFPPLAVQDPVNFCPKVQHIISLCLRQAAQLCINPAGTEWHRIFATTSHRGSIQWSTPNQQATNACIEKAPSGALLEHASPHHSPLQHAHQPCAGLHCIHNAKYKARLCSKNVRRHTEHGAVQPAETQGRK